MTRWTGIVLALPEVASDEMASRLVTYLHPVAGRPLVWHTAAALAAMEPAPERVVVVAGVEIQPGLFQDIPVPVQVVSARDSDLTHIEEHVPLVGADLALVADAAAFASGDALRSLLDAAPGTWLDAGEGRAAAACLPMLQLPQLFRLPEPLLPPNGLIPGRHRVPATAEEVVLVRGRADLAEVSRRVRDRLVRSLMRGGVTFLLPESVLVDVDVRVGRDSLVYPGVVLEGATTIGEETVVGPGCRVIDSWIGSGVELKGWNYVSHTSIRNRAILEPYVRRGYD